MKPRLHQSLHEFALQFEIFSWKEDLVLKYFPTETFISISRRAPDIEIEGRKGRDTLMVIRNPTQISECEATNDTPGAAPVGPIVLNGERENTYSLKTSRQALTSFSRHRVDGSLPSDLGRFAISSTLLT